MFLSSFAWGSKWFRSFFAWGSKIILVQRYFYPLPLEVWSWPWFTDTSILLHSRFEAVLKTMIFSLDWTYTGLPNLVLFRSRTWKPVKLGSVFAIYLPGLTIGCQFGCTLALSRISTWLDLQLWCHATRFQIQLSWDLGFFENSDLFELPSFSPKVFLKLLSGARPFFTLHSCFRQENIYLMQGAMQCMVVHEWIVQAFNFIFHLNSFYSSLFF